MEKQYNELTEIIRNYNLLPEDIVGLILDYYGLEEINGLLQHFKEELGIEEGDYEED